MAGERADAELAGETENGDGRERLPPFLLHGLLTVGIFVVAMSAMVYLSDGDVQGPALVTFSVGFSVFMTFYFVAMYVGWLFLR